MPDLDPFGVGRVILGHKATMALKGLVLCAEQTDGSVLAQPADAFNRVPAGQEFIEFPFIIRP
jgi:hypothetical protein